MKGFLRAVEARILREREERLAEEARERIACVDRSTLQRQRAASLAVAWRARQEGKELTWEQKALVAAEDTRRASRRETMRKKRMARAAQKLENNK